MKNILYTAGLFILLLAAKCEKGPTYELGQNFELQAGQSAACDCKDKLNVQFAGIKEDSRCPKNVNCLWAGQVIVELLVDGQSTELALGSRKKGQTSKTVNGYTIELKKVSPYPVDQNNIKAEEYIVELVVTGKP